MREIKFRVWDKELKEMNYVSLEDLYEDDYWYDGETSVWSVLNDCNNKNERFEINQYTGLKDKNGVEIYEGDKVKIIRYDYENGSENSWGDLIPEEVETIITMSFEFAYTFNIMGEFDEESMEVVGNIYEDLKESGE